MTQACVDELKESSIRVTEADRDKIAIARGSKITATMVVIKIETEIGIKTEIKIEIMVEIMNAIKAIVVKADGVKETTKKTQSTKAVENAL